MGGGGDGPTLALLVDHDDAEREFRYVSTAETFAEPEPITDVGRRLGWTVVSMARDWETVFAPLEAEVRGLDPPRGRRRAPQPSKRGRRASLTP